MDWELLLGLLAIAVAIYVGLVLLSNPLKEINMDRPFKTNRFGIGRFTIDLLHLVGTIGKISFENKILKGLLLIELRKYEGSALGMSLKEKYKKVKKKRF